MTSGALKSLEKDFGLSREDMRAVVKKFHLEMDRGLSGLPSSLKMIPAYVDRPTGDEKGEYIAIDLGGTNFRVLSLTLKGCGICLSPRVMKFVLRKKDIASTGKALFGFLAASVRKFIKEEDIDPSRGIDLGFTFSFPVKQTGISSGTLVTWTKGFSASGVRGRDVMKLLKRSFEKENIGDISVAALVNDTVGTLASGSYGDRSCDVGVIVGTGTNACYVEELRKIKKLKNLCRRPGFMVVNIEWGNFNKLKVTRYDRRLDIRSNNPGAQMLEKMVSGMYLGDICGLIINDFISKSILSCVRDTGWSDILEKCPDLSHLLSDRSQGLIRIENLLRKSGVRSSSLKDRKVVKKICEIVSLRAARIIAAAIVAVVTKTDPRTERRHTIAIDGSVYEKLPGFSENVKKAIAELAGSGRGNIRMALTKDGSGKGAAIIAAIAAANK